MNTAVTRRLRDRAPADRRAPPAL